MGLGLGLVLVLVLGIGLAVGGEDLVVGGGCFGWQQLLLGTEELGVGRRRVRVEHVQRARARGAAVEPAAISARGGRLRGRELGAGLGWG